MQPSTNPSTIIPIKKNSSNKNKSEDSDRPSTAPSKSDEKNEKPGRILYGNGSLKRLPSPNIQSNSN